MNQDLRRRAAAAREVPLERVLSLWGTTTDRRDRSKWHTEQGSLSISGAKFMNWRQGVGGGGAIDLVMHLAQLDFPAAVTWIEQHLLVGPVATSEYAAATSSHKPRVSEGQAGTLRLPVRDDRLLDRVRQYLTRRRQLQESLLEPIIDAGRLYADQRGNAVFLLTAGKAHRPVGAELRGTGPRLWRGMAPGTCKDAGFFWIGTSASREIVLCESAIDAISCFQICPQRICISTSGARANPRWLRVLLARDYIVHCGFDADAAGNDAADRMRTLYPCVKRLSPPAHDWNDVLTSP